MKDFQILPQNEHIFEMLKLRSELLKHKPELIYPWWRRPCKVKLLLLTDGLDFGTGNFGLSTFVSILKNDGRSYAEFDITIAHRGGFVGDPGVTVSRSIPNFRFTDTSHFTTSMYDQIWLFGASGVPLSQTELPIVSSFMNSGGGVFATGDHGNLGETLCGSITRVRSMRRWNNALGNVGMTDPMRNDTNRRGNDTLSQFNDQSDDVPQEIQPRLYSSYWWGFLRETYPHPLLCSPLGRIKVLPDHPHEGECIEPSDLTQTYIDGTPEYPMGIAPEVIAYSTVLANTTSGTKQATQFQTFGAICAYDGHKANVGRVVTDATWHHFVNVNLIGELGASATDPSKNRNSLDDIEEHGFLYSIEGQKHLQQIKHYFINIAVWNSRKENHACFNSRWIWELVFQHRVLEATMDNPSLKFEKISPVLLYSIGSHAVDVLGKKASQCRRLQLILDFIRPILPNFAEQIDPWAPFRKIEPKPPIPWFDFNPLLAMALGGGIVAMRDAFGEKGLTNPNKIKGEEIMSVFNKGVKKGIDLALKELNTDLKRVSSIK